MSLRETWTAGEVAGFLSAARGTRLEPAWHLAVFGGLRAGELLALRWRDVDLATGRLSVRHAVAGVPYAAIKPAVTCPHARVTRLGARSLEVLEAHDERQKAERSEWGAHYRVRGLVVCCENGEALHPRTLAAALAEATAGAGLPPISVADLRRSHPLIAIEPAGVV